MKQPVVQAYISASLALSCATATAQDIYLRNSIGPTNATTNGNLPIGTDYTSGQNWFLAPVVFTASQTLTLKSVRLIGAQQTTTALDFSNHDWRLMIWSSYVSFVNSPTNGTLVNVLFDVPTQGPTTYGTTGFIPGTGIRPTFELTFDVLNLDVQLQNDHEIVLAIEAVIPSTSNGRFGVMETIESGSGDWGYSDVFPPPGGVDLAAGPWTMHSGRVSFEVIGQLTTPCAGDVNGDNQVDLGDLAVLLSHFGTASGATLADGDLDGDGDVELDDLASLLSQFGSTCQ